RLARHALNNAKECWPETADISQSGRVPSHYRYLAITQNPEGRFERDHQGRGESRAGGDLAP
ncbi:hypothetical protein, partial [Sphingomonas paucimobilis]|uniref:hypothetical protein n=1 Tax=Sphingomonas paucimobilis TaxID=13689 RepID=UPI0019D1CCFB